MSDAYTEVYCILGNPVRHSFSPAMHNAGFAAIGRNAVYTAFEPAEIAGAVEAIRSLGIRGASVTIPFKVAVMQYLDEIDDTAKQIGSVNTVVNRNGRLFGTNTDASGFFDALKTVCDPDDKRIAVFGGGGSARAVCFGICIGSRPKSVSVMVRNPGKTETQEFAEDLKDYGAKKGIEVELKAISEWDLIRESTEIIVNTTCVGMTPDDEGSILTAEAIPSGITVMDIVYRPRETKLIRNAKARNCRIGYGEEMLIRQGVRQFELWTGSCDLKTQTAMREALMTAIYGKRKSEGMEGI